MARILSRTLVARESRALLRDHPPASRLVNLRGRSGRPELLARIFEVELEPDGGGEAAAAKRAAAARRLEDVIHGIVVRRAAPDWLPFIPGSSYWVPPRPMSHGLSELLRMVSSPMTKEEVMSLTTAREWPCAAHLRGDVSQDTFEKWLREVRVPPEDEDS